MLSGIEHLVGSTFGDTLGGDTRDNQLFGYDGNDWLLGRDGNDWIVGEAGSDTLTGGNGRDVFVFALGSGSDRVSDFEDGDDLLYFDVAGAEFSSLIIRDAGSDTVIQLGDIQVTLLNFDHRNLGALDVYF